MKSYHVGVAAEAVAAALFARAGYDVLVQYGANQPGYDLAVARELQPAKISVKGSKDGGWVLMASDKKQGVTYHEAIDAWAGRHRDQSVIYCFVQLKDVPFDVMPRVYLATIPEVVAYMKSSCGGHGYTSLREQYKWSGGKAAGTADVIPESWRMTEQRIAELLGMPAT